MKKTRTKKKKKIERETKRTVVAAIEAVTKVKVGIAKDDVEPKVEARTVIDGNRGRKALDLFTKLI